MSSSPQQTGNDGKQTASVPSLATDAVLVKSQEMPADAPFVRGYNFDGETDWDAYFANLKNVGFQSTHLGEAMDEVNRMLNWRVKDDATFTEEKITALKEANEDFDPETARCKIFMGFTSNMISCGVRETLRFIVQNKMVDCIVTTGGAIEEDIMKCFAHHYLGKFTLKGSDLRAKGLNRLGNLIVPNNNYCTFEDWFSPIFMEMLEEQKTKGKIWSPQTVIWKMGEKINNPDSVLYWAWKNQIPIFCPALTDGAIGDNIYFQSFNHPGFILDTAQDIRGINDIAINAVKTGMVILGGGVIKHHICNANLMRNGADFSVFINTATDYDGSDSGAKPDEAISWGKIRLEAKPVKVVGEASLLFPLLASQTFVKYQRAQASLAAGETPTTAQSLILQRVITAIQARTDVTPELRAKLTQEAERAVAGYTLINQILAPSPPSMQTLEATMSLLNQ